MDSRSSRQGAGVPHAILVCLTLLSGVGSLGCGEPVEDRTAEAIRLVNRSGVLQHLDEYSDQADDLLVVRDFIDDLSELATKIRSVRALVGDQVLDSLFSQVTVLQMTWEFVGSLDAVRGFWRDVEAIQDASGELYRVLDVARSAPSEENLARAGARAREVSVLLRRVLSPVSTFLEWTERLSRAVAQARRELRRFEQQAGFWGMSLVVDAVEDVVEFLEQRVLARALGSLRRLDGQLRRDIEALDVLLRAASPAGGPSGCGCGAW